MMRYAYDTGSVPAVSYSYGVDGAGGGTSGESGNSVLAVYEWDERDRLVRSQTPDVTA